MATRPIGAKEVRAVLVFPVADGLAGAVLPSERFAGLLREELA